MMDNESECNFNECDVYVLPMFMYTSGKVHMGHIRTLVISDVIARFESLTNKSSSETNKIFQPIAWDSFGLPAENAAKLNNVDPRKWTEDNIVKMKQQIQLFNFSFSWNTEYSTCDWDYYKFDQQIFCDLWNSSLAYQGEKVMPFCTLCDTVLAREQSINDKCWRCDNVVVYKNTNQIFIKTTAFANDLYRGINFFNATSKFKEIHKSWIGENKQQYEVFVKEKSIGYAYISNEELRSPIFISTVNEENETICLRSTSLIEQVQIFISNNKLGKEINCINSKNESKSNILSLNLEDWCVSRQRNWGTPIPLVICEQCGTYAWFSEEFMIEKQQQTTLNCFKCGKIAKKYSGTLDTLFTSSWYMYRNTDYTNQNKPFSCIKKNKIMDYYIGGMEHATGHCLYTRFMHKFFLSKKLVNCVESFTNLINQSVVLGKTMQCEKCLKYFNTDIDKCDKCNIDLLMSYQKMSKSKFNGIDPVELLKKYDSDAIKMHLLYASPVTKEISWSENGIQGMQRLITNIKYLCENRQATNDKCSCSIQEYKLAYKQLCGMYDYMKKTLDDMTLSLNVSMTPLFITIKYLKKIYKCSCKRFEDITRLYLMMLSCFAPMCASLCYEKLFNTKKYHGIDEAKKIAERNEELLNEKMISIFNMPYSESIIPDRHKYECRNCEVLKE